mgnify:CR=1 FL=1
MLKGISESSLRACRSRLPSGLRCAVKPKLIVLDEPVDGLDPVMRRQIWSIMLDDVAANNTTVGWYRLITCASWRMCVIM